MSFDLATSLMSTGLRSAYGIGAKPAGRKPEKNLRLISVENDPYSRLVREAATELDLDLEILPPTPMGSADYPRLEDPNTDEKLRGTEAIIVYLFQQYDGRDLPLKWRFQRLQALSSRLASLPRLCFQQQSKQARQPQQMLELYSFESSPYARPVRELLDQMRIPYLLRNCGRTKPQEWILPSVRKALNIQTRSSLANRRALEEKEGRVSIPYLYDPNTGAGLFESGEIIAYLKNTYGVADAES
ncbi:glutathione S-transferase [Pseudomaricurvus alkylphenolicus]|nr:glutathione S-transferase [Pseudomaricurvus alkylphenolicus]